MSGLQFQKKKVNIAVNTVSDLKGAIREYEKANVFPELKDLKITQPYDFSTSLDTFGIDPLPIFNLNVEH